MRANLFRMILMATVLWSMQGQCVLGQGIPNRPLSLEECVAIALRRNPQITSSEQSVIGAQAGLTRARSSYYPQLSLDADATLTNQSAPDTRREAGLTVQQTLWRQGLRESVEESRASLRATELDHTSTMQGLVEQVSRDYYEVLAARQLVGVAEAGVESARNHLEQVKARVELGAAAEVDILTVDDDLARAQLDLIDVRSSVRSALAQLKNSMGLSPEADFEIAEASPPKEENIPSLREAVQKGLENRAEVLAGQASVQASRYSLMQAKIDRGPVIDVTGGYSQRYANWGTRGSSWNVMLGLSLPLFDGYATKAAETSSRASLKRSEADLQRLANQVGLEVENALVEVSRTRERVAASATSVAAAEARLAAAEGKYQQGVGILLEVTDARVAVTNARANQVRARYNYQIALVSLQRALGTLSVPEVRERESETSSHD